MSETAKKDKILNDRFIRYHCPSMFDELVNYSDRINPQGHNWIGCEEVRSKMSSNVLLEQSGISHAYKTPQFDNYILSLGSNLKDLLDGVGRHSR